VIDGHAGRLRVSLYDFVPIELLLDRRAPARRASFTPKNFSAGFDDAKLS
jgi:hypothetical protein